MATSTLGWLAMASVLFTSTLASLEPYPASQANRGYDYQAPRQSSVSGVANEYLPPHQFRSGPAFSDSAIRSSSQTYLPPAQPSARYLPANPSNSLSGTSQQVQVQPEVVDARSSFLASSGLPGSRQMSSWYPHDEEQRQRSSSGGVPAGTYGAPGVNTYMRSSGGPSTSYGAPAKSYGTPGVSSYTRSNVGPSTSYGTPAASYGAPGRTFGTPAATYGTPGRTYGTPAATYGTPAATYGAPDNYVSRQAGGSSGYPRGRQNEDDGWNNEPARYSFRYHVNDPPSNNDFGHEESRDGSLVRGTYFVLLPDGRRQVVNYEADEHGYRPTISYETPEDLQRSNDLRSGSQTVGGPY